MIEKIISGGQTGADQGALDFALEQGIPCGGWCPEGRLCETGRIPGRYPVTEVASDDYNSRTRQNVLDADATLIIIHGDLKEDGTKLTVSFCQQYGKPFLVVDLKDPSRKEATIKEFAGWVRSNNIRILNVAGNRESNSRGIQEATNKLLGSLIFQQ